MSIQIITLQCESCGSNLDISPSMNKFACSYCGASQIVNRQGGTINLELVSNAIKSVQVGTDKTAAELALKRLEKDYSVASSNYNSFVNKRNDDLGKSWARWFVAVSAIAVIGGAMIGQSTHFAVGWIMFFALAITGYMVARKQIAIKEDEGLDTLESMKDGLKVILQRIGKNKEIVDS